MSDPVAASGRFEVVAVRYGTLSAPRSELFLRFASYDEPDEVVEMAFYFWVLRRGAEPSSSTPASTPPSACARAHCLWPPLEALQRLGIERSSVATLVVTHLHYDHVGNLAAFPEAELVVPKEGAELLDRTACRPLPLPSHVDPRGDRPARRGATLGARPADGGHRQIVEGVTAVVVGGHSPASR